MITIHFGKKFEKEQLFAKNLLNVVDRALNFLRKIPS